MTYTPIPAGTIDWDVPLNAALTDQDGRITDNEGAIAANTAAIATNTSDIVTLETQANNVKSFGALGDGTTDDLAAIQAAIDATNAAGGGIVFFPKGVYRISDSIVLKTGVTLQGVHSTGWPNRFTTPFCSIRPTFSFAGECAISMLGNDITGSPNNEGNVRIFDIDIDGSAISGGSVSGIHAQGHVLDVILERVTIKQFNHNGIHTNVGAGTQAPHDWFMDSVVCYNNASYGFSMSMTDGYIRNCIASANGIDGWLMGPFGSLTFDSCQALFNTGHGLNIGGGTQVGNLTITGFLTDRNGQDGIHLGTSTGSGSPPFVLSGITCNRDGRNGNLGGGGYAGLRVDGCANPIIISGLVVNTGVDDDTTGANSPQYGARFSTAAYVQVNGGYVHGDTTGWQDDANNTVLRRFNVDSATGPKGTPTFVYGSGPSTVALGYLLPNAATPPASPNSGSVIYGGTSRTVIKNSSGLNGTVPIAGLGTTSTTTVTNSTTETVLHTFAIAGNDPSAGSVYEISAWGNADWPVTTVPTLTLRLRVGGLAGDVLGTVVITCPATAGTTAGWRADAKVLLTSIGASANWRGNLMVANSIATALNENPIAVSDSNAGVTRSSTSTQDLVITAQWSAADAANIFRCTGAHGMRIR